MITFHPVKRERYKNIMLIELSNEKIDYARELLDENLNLKD